MVAVARGVAALMETGGLGRRRGRRRGASQVPPWVKHGGGTVGSTAGRLKARTSSSLDRQVDIKWGYPGGREGLRGLVLWRDPWAVDRVERAVEDVSGRRGSRPSPRKSSFHVLGHPRPSQAWPRHTLGGRACSQGHLCLVLTTPLPSLTGSLGLK